MKAWARAVVTTTLALGLCSLASGAEATRIEMTEFAFRPALIRVRAGYPVTLQLVNRGQIAHQFETDALRGLVVTVSDALARVEAPGLDVLRLQPSASATIQFYPRRTGRFRFACMIEGHREAGMEGVLEVY